ncbi:MAG: tripartite tricarboxylate transporter TctB family protein [Pseudomonadota bacterium]
MSTFSEHRRDYYGGGLMMLIGLGAALEAQRYGLGSLSHMGPGFFPVLLGVMMISVGALIAGTAYLSTEPDEESFLPARPEWFAWGCIIASPIAFIIFGEFAGLLPATFACVFVAAIGDRETTLPQAAGLGVFISILGLLIFSFLLKIPFPIIRGVW